MSKPVQKAQPPWSVPIAVSEVPETGRSFELVADAGVRAAVAKLAGVTDISRLQAALNVIPHRHGGLRVTGNVSAAVGQTCSVTLDPIENEIEGEIDLAFAPEGSVQRASEAEIEIGDDEPEPLIGGTIDLGMIATEFLILAIDPYPRKPGAVFKAVQAEISPKPFAALAALKKDRSQE
jgi:uncharacterized metal-binding protein YceD (DUF177 family)